VFVVTEGIFKNEAFLLRKDRVVQLGTELGGQGLISMVITDLDQDGQPELLFTYGAGLSPQMSAGTQTRVGMYAPYIDQERVIEANMAYMGIAAIRADDLAAASLYRLDGDQENLGKLSIEYSEIGTALVFQVNPDLPEEIKQSILTGD
jgi:hypothetical protein